VTNISKTFLPIRWRQKSTGIDMEQNYVTVARRIKAPLRETWCCQNAHAGEKFDVVLESGQSDTVRYSDRRAYSSIIQRRAVASSDENA